MTRRVEMLLLLLVISSGAGCVLDARGETAQATFSRTLTVDGPVTLQVETGSGQVVVRTSAGGSVKVDGRVTAGWRFWDGDPQDRVREIQRNPPIEQHGNQIEVGRWARMNNVRISYLVTVPRDTEVRLRTGSGDVEVPDLKGPVTADTGSGEIRIGRIDADVRARTGSGDVELAASAAGVTIRTGSGRVQVGGIGGEHAEVATGSGDVEVDGASGRLRVRTGSGRIRVAGAPSDEWDLGAGSGDVIVNAPQTAGFDVDLRTASGDIDARGVTSTERATRRELRGRIGSGGPLVTMSTGSGSITVR